MAAELITPVDELTRLPLPLVPLERVSQPDWHHHFHPKKSLLLQDESGRAVRNARLQRADYATHHYGYHGVYLGPPLPETEEEKFATVIMAAAGYMPHYGINFTKGEPRIAKLSSEQRHRLQTSGEIKVGAGDVVRGYIRNYIINQQIWDLNVKDLTLEEFIFTDNLERRRLIGHTLLALFTDKATESVNEPYYRAHKQQLILPGLPRNVRRFTKSSMGSTKIRDKLVVRLHERTVNILAA
jgi:hypothetical protein